MTLNPNAAFTALNELPYKTPMYVASFNVETSIEYTISAISVFFLSWIEQAQETWPNNYWNGGTLIITSGNGAGKTLPVYDTRFGDRVTFNPIGPIGGVQVGDKFIIQRYEKFCTYIPRQTFLSTEPLPYISNISGGGYSISPEEGSTSSASLKIEMEDHQGHITDMIHNATGRLQKKSCVVKAGYISMTEAQMLTIFTGEVTDYSYQKGGSWEFSVSDAIRDLNKNIFRDAGPIADGEENEITGNPIDLLLALLISDTGDGSKGIYDNLPLGYGLAMDASKVDVAAFEEIRDTFYPTTSTIFNFVMEDRIPANDFFKNQIYKPLNMYPIVKGNGQYSARIYRPILPPYSPITITEDDIIDIPSYDGNLPDLINEVQFSYNYDGSEFENIDLFSDLNSINVRGVGDRTLEVESEGIKESVMPGTEDFLIRSTNRIFNRYSNPPIKLSVHLLFKYLVIESGDQILVSNKFLPNLDTGLFDFEEIPMEVLKRTVDWKRGKVKLELLQTGYDQLKYAAISPELIVESVAGASQTAFTAIDIKDYEEGFFVSVWRRVLDIDSPTDTTDWYHLELVADDIEITDITGSVVTTDDIGVPYEVDMRIVYNDDPPSLTDYQTAWGRIWDDGDLDNAYVITP